MSFPGLYTRPVNPLTESNWTPSIVDAEVNGLVDHANYNLEGLYGAGADITLNQRSAQEHYDSSVHGYPGLDLGLRVDFEGPHGARIKAKRLAMDDGLTYLSDIDVYVSPLGSGEGGLDVGITEDFTYYSLWVIYNEEDEEVAGLCSLSRTDPTLPTGFTKKKRIPCWILTDDTTPHRVVPFYFNANMGFTRLIANGTTTETFLKLVLPVADGTWHIVTLAGKIPLDVCAANAMAVIDPRPGLLNLIEIQQLESDVPTTVTGYYSSYAINDLFGGAIAESSVYVPVAVGDNAGAFEVQVATSVPTPGYNLIVRGFYDYG